MIFGLEFPPISHVVEWPTLFGDGPFAVNKVVILMWISAAISFCVMWAGGRKQALVPTGTQNIAESAVGFIEDGIIMETIGPDGLKYTPYLLTLFTFILTCNIWGLIPGVQMPHCAPPCSTNAFCSAFPVRVLAAPSIVITRRPSACAAGTMQESTATPSISTVHAPHSPSPQPSLVPVRPQSSRNTSRSRFIGCAVTLRERPLTVSFMALPA